MSRKKNTRPAGILGEVRIMVAGSPFSYQPYDRKKR